MVVDLWGDMLDSEGICWLVLWGGEWFGTNGPEYLLFYFYYLFLLGSLIRVVLFMLYFCL